MFVAAVCFMFLITSTLLIGDTTNRLKSNQMLFFEERRKPEYQGKNLAEKSREPTTQPTYSVESGNWTRAVD